MGTHLKERANMDTLKTKTAISI